jgi:hypothetical protein
MSEFDERTQANMDVVLEEVCAELPNGGDHQSRKYIAEQLIHCARGGRTTLGELMYTARRALVQIERNQRSAWECFSFHIEQFRFPIVILRQSECVRAMPSKNERVELEMKIMKYRNLARQAPDPETKQRIDQMVSELQSKLREIDE